MRIIPIILSGGAGSRLWPLSWGDHPKQFLKLTSDKTMIQETLLRLKGLELGTPIVSCGEGHRFLVAQQLGEVMEEMALRQAQGPQILLECFFAIVFPKNLHQNSNKFADRIPGNSCAKTLEFLLQIFGMIYCKLTSIYC